MIKIIEERHSVRSYSNKEIEGEILKQLQQEITNCNKESGLSIQLYLNEPAAFSNFLAKYGKFENVKNYIVLAGPKTNDLDEKCGYYGEKIVLKAQELGLNTCWVASTYSKKKTKVSLNANEKMRIVIAIGYGTTSGNPHKNKPLEELADINDNSPEWFINGVKAAQLAPTAINQQKFYFTLDNNKVNVKSGFGPRSKVDIGIVKYHFELGANNNDWHWK